MTNTRSLLQALPFTCSCGYIVLFLLIVVSAGCVSTENYVTTKYSDKQYISLARNVFEHTNSLRSEPSRYIAFLKHSRALFKGDTYYPDTGLVGIRTQEGLNAVDEAINALSKQQAVEPLVWSDELARLAEKHVLDTGAKGLLGHDASNGEGFSQRVSSLMKRGLFSGISENISYGWGRGKEVVVQLVVDDGVPGRGHRKNILKKASRYSGVSCGYHKQYTVMCVALYAR